MSQIGTKKVSTGRRFAEGLFVGLGIATGLFLFQSLLFGGMIVARMFFGY